MNSGGVLCGSPCFGVMNESRPIMSFNEQDREYPVGAQFIGAPPMYRPMARRCPPQADTSAVRAYMRRLQHYRFWLLKFVIALLRRNSYFLYNVLRAGPQPLAQAEFTHVHATQQGD